MTATDDRSSPGSPVSGESTSPLRSGARLDELAELEEERRFLLRSLRDLEREHDAGDVDDDDYQTLKDGYTVRAAAVLRQIDDGKRALAPKPPRRWGRMALVVAAVVVAAGGVGFALAQAWGERGADQEITGFSPGDDIRAVLASGRAAMGDGNFAAANELFLRALDAERDRGVDNAEALTYWAWTLALLTLNNPDAEASERQLEPALIALEQATEMDPTYADPYCFIAIIEANFRDDPQRALPFLEQCEANDPPAETADIMAAFADEIRAATD